MPTASRRSACSRPRSFGGLLTKDEFDLRVGQALASRTYADLGALTADIPALGDQLPALGRGTPVSLAGCSASGRRCVASVRLVPSRWLWAALRFPDR